MGNPKRQREETECEIEAKGRKPSSLSIRQAQPDLR